MPILDTPHIMAFWLISIRLTGLFLSAPLFSQQGIPNLVKVYWLLIISFLFACMVPTANIPIIHGIPQLMVFGAVELLVGVLLGMTAQLILSAIQLMGEIVAVQMGLNMTSLLDPINHVTAPTIAQLMFFLGVQIFICLNGHHWLLAGFGQTLLQWPLGHELVYSPAWADGLMSWLHSLLLLGLQFALPALATLLLIDIGSAYLAKAMPQLNMMTLTLPIKILAGLWILSASAGGVQRLLNTQVHNMPHQLHILLPSSAKTHL